MAELPLNIGTDPAVVQAQANARRIRTLAQESALRQQIEVASSLGDEGVLSRIEGITQEQIQAALANPFTTLKDIARSARKDRRGIDEGRSQQGLFFSSTRAKDLASSAENQQRDRQSAFAGAQSAFGRINEDLEETNLSADDSLENALFNAQDYQSNLIGQYPGVVGDDVNTAGTGIDPGFTFGGGRLKGQNFKRGDLAGVTSALTAAGYQKPLKYLNEGTRRREFFLQ